MAAPSYVNAGTGATDATGAWSYTCQASEAAGRVFIVHILQDGGTATAMTVTGGTNIEALDGTANTWTPIMYGSYRWYWCGGTSDAVQYLLIGRATSTSAPTISGGNSTSEDLYIRSYQFSNVNTGTTQAALIENYDSTYGDLLVTLGNSNTASDSSVSTLGPDRLALNFVAVNDDNAIAQFSGQSGGTWTEVAEYAESSGTDGAIQLQYATMTSAGTINGGTASITDMDAWGVIGFALIGTAKLKYAQALTQIGWPGRKSYAQAQARIKQTYPFNGGSDFTRGTEFVWTSFSGSSGSSWLAGEEGGSFTELSYYVTNVSYSEAAGVGTMSADTPGTASRGHQYLATPSDRFDVELLYKVKLDPTIGYSGRVVYRLVPTSGGYYMIGVSYEDATHATLYLYKFPYDSSTGSLVDSVSVYIGTTWPTGFICVHAFAVGDRHVARTWKEEDTEPETWQLDITDSTYTAAGKVGLAAASKGDVVFDDFLAYEATGGIQGPTFAQAQAQISPTKNAYSQAQVQITAAGPAVNRSYAQGQARIKQIYLLYAQAQVWIKQTYPNGNDKTQIWGFYRPSTDVFYEYGGNFYGGGSPHVNAIPVIANFNGTGPEQGWYREDNNYWYVPNHTTGTWDYISWGIAGDLPAPHDCNNYGYDELCVYRPSDGGWYHKDHTGQNVFYGGSSDVPVSVDYDGDGIDSHAAYRASTAYWYISSGGTSEAFGAADDIAVPGDYNGDGIAEKAVYRTSNTTWYIQNGASDVFALSVGDIAIALGPKVLGPTFAQAQAKIINTYQIYAQAQAKIKATYFTKAQSQARIKQLYQNYGQAQARIKQTYKIYAQAQSHIKIVSKNYGQAQGRIKQAYQSYAQAQATLRTTYRVYAQAHSRIKQTYLAFAQAQTIIVKAYQSYAQSQAILKSAYLVYAQAQATIYKPVATNDGYGQAQAQIKTTYQGYAQGQARTKQAYQGYAQANTYIKTTNIRSYAQSQAQIKATYQAYGQTQARIKQTYRGYAQANTWIKQIALGYGQALAKIKQIMLEIQ